MLSNMRRPGNWTAVAVLAATSLLAQVETARITGTVKDPTGAVVAGAGISFTNVDTNITSAATTDGTGRYTSIPLRTGRYRVTAEHAGFRKVVRDGIVVRIQETAVVDFGFELGAVTQEVAVTAAAPQLTVNEAAQAQVIDNQKIVDLPLNGRNYIQLALLSAGTSEPAANSRVGGFSGSGMRASLNNYVLDGMDNNNRQLATAGRQAETIRPSIDAIQEFKIMTNSFSAEYGGTAAAVVNVGIKSGTNSLHGTLFEFLRNEALDAKNFFDRPDQPKPSFKRNQFGWSAGGPIRKNHTFFFGDYEWSRIRESLTANSTIPSARMIAGDYSALLPTRIYDPGSYSAATGERQVFPNNVIPGSRFDPVAVKAFSWFPLPNKEGLTNNYLANPPSNENLDRWDFKVDHTFGSRDSLYGRYSSQRDGLPPTSALPPPAYGGGTNGSQFQHTGRNVGLAFNHIFTPNLILALKAGWNQISSSQFIPDSPNRNAEIGFRGVGTEHPGSASFLLSGYAVLGSGAANPNTQDSQTRQLVGDLTWIRGRHSLKAGVNLAWLQMYVINAASSSGQITFDGAYTRNTRTAREGNAVADMLLGFASSAVLSKVAYMNQRAPWWDFYVTDEWKATRTLTLNLGLRYELHPPFVETRNGWANFDLDSAGALGQFAYARNGSRYDRATLRTDTNNFGPRFGFAWQAVRNTVVRGGYGVYFVGFQPFGDTPYLHSNPPFQVSVNLTTDPITPSIVLRNGLPPDALDLRRVRNATTSSWDRSGTLAYTQQWSFSVQRQMPAQTLLEVGYYANTAHKLLQRIEGNWALPAPGNINDRRRFKTALVEPVGSSITLGNNNRHQGTANANFHSMQVRVEKRLTHGLSMLASYVWSKSISDARGVAPDGGSSQVLPQNPRDLRSERALSDEHLPQRFVTSGVYDLPFGRGKRWLARLPHFGDALLGGWSAAAIATVSSGNRVNLTVRGNPANTGDPNRPNVLHDWRLPAGQQTLQQWFDVTAFEANLPYTFGNAARNLIGAPSLVNFDLAVYKAFRLSESKRLQFRAEAFDAFNTPHFGSPAAQVGTPSLGTIASAGRPRNLQFGLKLVF